MIEQMRRRWLPIVCLVVLAAVGVFLLVRPSAGTAQSSAISADAAVYAAVTAAEGGSPIGRMTGAPTDFRGALMTFGQARAQAGQPLTSSVKLWDWRDRPVWRVAMRGDGIENDEIRGEVSLVNAQWVVVLDAETAELIETSIGPTGTDIDTSSLPPLSLPAGPVALPTPIPASQRPPAPTAAPMLPPAPIWHTPTPAPTR